jgi:Surface-adhesin protein E
MLRAQSTPEWRRVYTFDESTIELNTSLVTLISNDVTRVRFRWIFHEPELLSEVPGLKYKSRLEVMEVNCSLDQYRPYHLTFFDTAGNTIHIQDSPEKWRKVAPGSMIEKLFVPACELVKKKTLGVAAQEQQLEKLQLEKVARFAYDVAQHLEEAKDFEVVIDKYFVRGYLDGYLRDKHNNWFLKPGPRYCGQVKRQGTAAILRGHDECRLSELLVSHKPAAR